MIQGQLDLLWSINERLAGNKGLNLERPSLDWVEDIVSLPEPTIGEL